MVVLHVRNRRENVFERSAFQREKYLVIRMLGVPRASIGGTLQAAHALPNEQQRRSAMPAILVPIFLIGVPVVLVGGYYVMHMH